MIATATPNADTASIQLRASELSRALVTVLTPPAADAVRSARIVCDFDDGAAIAVSRNAATRRTVSASDR